MGSGSASGWRPAARVPHPPGRRTRRRGHHDATSDCDIRTALRDGDGGSLNSIDASENETSPLPYNTPGPGVYYITVGNGCPVDTYELKVTGPMVGGPRPGPASPTTNGHNGITTAFGPLAGGTLYGASIDAYNEEDWFFLYTARAGTFDVATLNTNDASSDCDIRSELLDRGGQSLNSTDASEDRISHIRYTAAGPAKFVLRFRDGCPVDTYRFRVAPAGLLTATPPPVPVTRPSATKACKSARKARTTARRRLKVAKAKVRRARTARARRRARQLVKKRNAALKRANKRVKAKCS